MRQRAVRRSRKPKLWYRSAIEARNHLPESRAKSELGFDLRIDLYIPVLTYGDITPVFEVLESAEGLAAAIADNDRLSRVAGCLAQACWWIADYPRALELAKRALSVGPEGRALMTLAWTESALGDFTAAKKHLEELLTMARAVPVGEMVRNGRPSTTVMSLVWIVSCRGELGEFEEAIADAREAVHIAEEIDQPWSRAAAYYALGSIFLKRRSFAEAIAVLERASACVPST